MTNAAIFTQVGHYGPYGSILQGILRGISMDHPKLPNTVRSSSTNTTTLKLTNILVETTSIDSIFQDSPLEKLRKDASTAWILLTMTTT